MSFNLKWPGYHLKLDQRTHVMGVLNVTPDSFSDGGRFYETEKAVGHGLAMTRDGADIIDVGGESTRPYSDKISSEEEISRIVPVIESLSKEISIPISIDTCKKDVAEEAIKAGASIINDISSFRFDPQLASAAAEFEVPVVLMHMKGVPQNMQDNPTYEDLITEIIEFLENAVARAEKAGIREDLIIVDPGIGFGKSFNDNLLIINRLSRFESLCKPILLGSSNKAFIGRILNKEADERDVGTMSTVAAGVLNGANIIRVHNVKMAVDTVKIVDAIKREKISN